MLYSYELPPTALAKPLPVIKTLKPKPTTPDEQAKKRITSKRKKPRDGDDDTPKEFARLMAYQSTGRRIPSGLDDGSSKKQGKKRKRETNTTESVEPKINSRDSLPKIQSGEKMSDFSARVNAALPVSGLIHSRRKDPLGLKGSQTKMERRMQRMQKEWREVEAKRKDQLEEAKEEAEEEEDNAGPVQGVSRGVEGKKSKKGKKRKMLGADGADDDDDPWAAIKVTRNEKASGLVGLHDVVQAPPQFTKIPKEKFRVQNGAKVDVADIPNTAGSLRRREELGQARRSIVEGYRKMMQGKRKESVMS